MNSKVSMSQLSAAQQETMPFLTTQIVLREEVKKV